MLRYDGTAWRSVPRTGLPSDDVLRGVAAAGGTVWAVGTYVDPNSSSNRRKLILQRAGGSWQLSAAPRVATYEHLAAVDATGPADAWAVGAASSDMQSAPPVPLALRWNGTSWTREALPAAASPVLTGAAASGPDAVWTVGYRFELNAYSNRTLTALGTR